MTVPEALRFIRSYQHGRSHTEDEDFLYTEALDYLITKNVDPKAMLALGGFYYGKREFALAQKYYEMAAEYDELDAIVCLGYIYYYGRTGQRDYEKAFACYEKGARLGHLVSSYKLADMYKNGYGVEKSYARFCQIIEELYPKVKDSDNAFDPVPEICMRLARIRTCQGNPQEAISLYETSRLFLTTRLHHNAFFGDVSNMKWTITDLYDLKSCDLAELDLYDLFFLLTKPCKVEFYHWRDRHFIEAVLENDALVYCLDGKWFRTLEDVFLKARIKGERLTALSYDLYDFQVVEEG